MRKLIYTDCKQCKTFIPIVRFLCPDLDILKHPKDTVSFPAYKILQGFPALMIDSNIVYGRKAILQSLQISKFRYYLVWIIFILLRKR